MLSGDKTNQQLKHLWGTIGLTALLQRRTFGCSGSQAPWWWIMQWVCAPSCCEDPVLHSDVQIVTTITGLPLPDLLPD